MKKRMKLRYLSIYITLIGLQIVSGYKRNYQLSQSDEHLSKTYSSTNVNIKTSSNRAELEKESLLEKEFNKIRLSKNCGRNLANYENSRLFDNSSRLTLYPDINCTTSNLKLTSDQLKDFDLNKYLKTHENNNNRNNFPSPPYEIKNETKIFSNKPNSYLSYSYSSSSNKLSSSSPSYKGSTGLNTKLISSSPNNENLYDLHEQNKTHHGISYGSRFSSYNLKNRTTITKTDQLSNKLASQIEKLDFELQKQSNIKGGGGLGHFNHDNHEVKLDEGTIGKSVDGGFKGSSYSNYNTGFSSVNIYKDTNKGNIHQSSINKEDVKSIHSNKDIYKQQEYNNKFKQNYHEIEYNKNGEHDHSTSIKGIKGAPIKSIPSQGKSILFTDEKLQKIEREKTKNVVKLAATDQLNSEIVTNRTRAYLSCESGEMIVKINFTQNFRGIVYANYDRSSQCKFYGDGGRYYEMRIPLLDCGTKQEAPRLFINNIVFRFHQTLELEEDEIKTIICRYPPPLAPVPIVPIVPIVEPTHPVPYIVPTKLSEIELILVICALLFLTLLLLGTGISYYCLKRRNIKIVRKHRLVSGAPSEITKISHSTFEPVRIPRIAVSDYTSESETRTILSDASSIRQEQYKINKLQHLPELKVQHLNTTYLANQHFVEEEIENVHNKKQTTNYFKKVPPLPPASIPDNDNWSHTEYVDVQNRKEYQIQKPNYSTKLEKTHFVDLEEDMSIEEKLIKNKTTFPTPKYQVKSIDNTYITNIEEKTTSLQQQDRHLSNEYLNNKQQYNKDSLRSKTSLMSKYEDQFMYECKLNIIKNLFNTPLPLSARPPKMGFTDLTNQEKNTWSNLIQNDEFFRNLILESNTYEEYINISRDIRYENYFTPRTWETIINTLSNRDIINRWNTSEDQKFNEQMEMQICEKKLNSRKFGGTETMNYSKHINKLVDGARERLMEKQFESSQKIYMQSGGGSIRPRLFSSSNQEQQALLDKSGSRRNSIHNQESRSITEEDINFVKPINYRIDNYFTDDASSTLNKNDGSRYRYESYETTKKSTTGNGDLGRNNISYNTLGKISTMTDEREEIKSVTETHVDDHWYSRTLNKY